MKIIGLELRLRNAYTGATKEILLLPLDIEIPDGTTFEFPCTLHTEIGDLSVNLQQGSSRAASVVLW